jgi:leucyl aminopeptidase
MNIKVTPFTSSLLGSDLVVVLASPDLAKALSSGKQLPRSEEALKELVQLSGGVLKELVLREKFEGAKGVVLTTPILRRKKLVELALFGLGKGEKESFERFALARKIGAAVSDHARRIKARTVTLVLGDFSKDIAATQALAQGIELGMYRFLRYKSEGEVKNPYKAPAISLVTSGETSRLRDAMAEASAFSSGAALARDLVNTPPRDCTPQVLLKSARDLARRWGLSFQALDRKKLEKVGAYALLAVAQGSEEPPYLLKLKYKPKGRTKRVITLVGKGVTFDSGGLSIKTAGGMETMKIDMAGAAAVLGALRILAELGCPHEVRAYIPTVENMINGRATRPGDIVRGVSGKSIEILNTDAEGRLILSDALTLAEEEGTDQIIDVATLTGACVVALGNDYAGLFSTDEKLAAGLIEAGAVESERFWRMPLAPEYKDLIKSPTADIKNTGGPVGGAITAALFLKEFVHKTPWAHLDIAGPAMSDGDKGAVRKGGTGFAARTLARYLMEL